MIRIIKVDKVEKFAAAEIQRSHIKKENKNAIKNIIKNVEKNGDAALRRYEKKFNGADIVSLRLSQSEIKDAYSMTTTMQLDALRLAKKRLKNTERAIRSKLKDMTIKHKDGIRITKKFIPIQSVGCYVPGGLAKYPSSAIMSVVPAKVAGVKRVVVTSPPNSDGTMDHLTVVAADLCGADEIYKTGGAQAIAALSYGTESIRKVEKIVGPGGVFVTGAKSMISERTGIDMLAGPTELGIIADIGANPRHIALDLISQAEHGSDTVCYLITTSEKLAKAVNAAVSKITQNIQRSELVKASLKNNGFIAICNHRPDTIRLANMLAPEHLQIMTKNPGPMSTKITSPGLVLLGYDTPSSAGDYFLGSNHILPTDGFGKIRGSLSVLDFLKMSTHVSCTRSSLADISEHLQVLTDAERLSNHYEAVRDRLK